MPTPYFAIHESLDSDLSTALAIMAADYLGIAHSNQETETPKLDLSSIAFFTKHGLQGILAESSLKASLPKDSLRQLMADVSLTIAASNIQALAFDELLRQFREDDLPAPIVFKGAALGALDYKATWHRPKTDFDLLIRDKDRASFNQSLLKQGFVRKPGIAGKYVSHQDSYYKQVSASAYIWIDLHWKISNRQMLASLMSYDSIVPASRNYFSKQAEPIAPDLAETRLAYIPSRADAIVLAAQHIVGHHSEDTRLLWFFDLCLLLEQCNAQDHQALLKQCHTLKVAGLVLASLSYAEALFRVPQDRELMSQLARLAELPEYSQILLRKPHSRLNLIWWDIRAIDSWAGKYRFVQENIFPDASYMRAQFPARFLGLSHLKRWFS